MASNPAIISLEDFTESINMLVYGDSGVGKTVLGGTATKALFLAIESGTISAKRQGSNAKLWPIKQWQDLQEAYDWLEENPDEFDWIIIDSITQMQKMCMRGILDTAVAENKSRDPDIPALPDWQKYYHRFERFVLAFNDLPINTLYLATTMKHTDEESGEAIVLPNIAGPSYAPMRESQSVCAQMGIVAYLKVTTDSKSDDDAPVSRKMLFQTLPPTFAKDRYDVFPRWAVVTKSGKQLTTMDAITKRVEGSGSAPVKAAPRKAPPVKAAPVKAAPVKAAPKKATAVRPRPSK
jgi:hypothetical protein